MSFWRGPPHPHGGDGPPQRTKRGCRVRNQQLAALLPLLLGGDRWRPLRPGTLTRLAWTASAVLVLAALWQLVVVFTAESQTYLAGGTARTVWGLAYAPLFAVPALMTAVTWSYAKRQRAVGRWTPPAA
ncbi:hypothetical protein M4J06_005714 [Streptomyces coelicoflavus]|uniref:hypothetical protein n=1 Tax=Streptomyces coelicoflavus TaxID=285562 RepID=UPI00210E6472|nr:hypothetical protein [Streptomyces coelicoflavus]MCQ4201563.1 hypothetical protein [Streptomyces coelicoflavus]